MLVLFFWCETLAGEMDVRFADKNGPDGCLSATSANAGLIESTSLVTTVMEPIWQKHCATISRADFWVLFAKLAVERADPTNTIRIPFQYGRKDNYNCSTGENRLPGAQLGLTAISHVFVTQMGLTMNDAGTVTW